jgi:molybdopterin converting factor small subunit
MADADSVKKQVAIRILFFAKAREIVKVSEETLYLDRSWSKVRSLFEEILNRWPSLRPLQDCLILARNQGYLDLDSEEEVELLLNDEIAVIPPISSG